ncbi:hypothetical protein, partial [Klebsiella aerogenes]|uniref:hypothetical protein n=1 Tax=Klebsiella aerogenes TaxID=548 RepID=UPI001952FB14
REEPPTTHSGKTFHHNRKSGTGIPPTEGSEAQKFPRTPLDLSQALGHPPNPNRHENTIQFSPGTREKR